MTTVTRNEVTATKPEWMTMEHWIEYEVPRIGKSYGKQHAVYGKDYPEPISGVEVMEDGCSGGACSI